MSNIRVSTTDLMQILEMTPAHHNLMLVGRHGIGKSYDEFWMHSKGITGSFRGSKFFSVPDVLDKFTSYRTILGDGMIKNTLICVVIVYPPIVSAVFIQLIVPGGCGNLRRQATGPPIRSIEDVNRLQAIFRQSERSRLQIDLPTRFPVKLIATITRWHLKDL